MRTFLAVLFSVAFLALVAVAFSADPAADAQDSGATASANRATRERPERFVDPPVGDRVTFSAREWRERLTPVEFHVLREEGTEPAYAGAFHANHTPGLYRCAGCGAPLFASADKFDSHTGWPSYTRPVAPGRVATRRDGSIGTLRTEVHCARCGGHLGHVFPDGPPPTGQRYCINAASLDFDPQPSRSR